MHALMCQVVENVFQAGAAAVTIHGRTMEQRYRKAADWQLLQQVAGGSPAPIIGNGDILTQYEVSPKPAALHPTNHNACPMQQWPSSSPCKPDDSG